jgi:regulator of sirC expression with transglutaminase-like and TPR domain
VTQVEHTDFAEIVGMPDELLDLGRATLVIAQGLDPCCDVDGSLDSLDELAANVREMLPPDPTAAESAEVLREYLFETLGFHGNTQDYFDPKNSFLHEVIARRKGIPIPLSIVAMEVARRADIPAFGIGFPGHFLLGIGRREACILMDAFHGGRRLNGKTLTDLLRGVAGPDARVLPEHLRPANKRSILTRLLLNLRGVYQRRAEPLNMLNVLDRLVELNPFPVGELRDRGRMYAQLGCDELAREDLTTYLARAPHAADAHETRELLTDVVGRTSKTLN